MVTDSSTSSSKWPRAAALAVLLIAASEAAFLATSTEPLCGLPLFQPQVDDACLIVKRELVPHAAGAIALVGDSSCLTGLKPDIITRETGLPCVNLGTISSHTTHGFADLAMEAIKHKPKMIVLALLPQSVELNEERTRIFGTYARYLNAYSKTNPVYHVTLEEQWDWNTHRHQFNIFPPEFGGSFRKYRTYLMDNGGWQPERGKLPPPDFVRAEFRPDEFSVAGLKTMFDLTAEHGLPVVLWWNSMPTLVTSESYQGQIASWTAKWAQKYPNTIVPRPTMPRWEDQCFGSVTHLTPAAAGINSEELGNAVRRLQEPHTK